ncbi:MAG: arylsulfatase A-like enzyme [Planctomycetota bacterium]|jgi:arylsulfatase A-like enzyme
MKSKTAPTLKAAATPILIVVIAFMACSCRNSENETTSVAEDAPPPNIVLLFSDDAGFADFSMNGNTLIKTPHIDSIAKNGVTFSQGYVSAAVCSPSRAGLLTGRYQQRFGHEYNLGENYSKTDPTLMGLPIGESTIADELRKRGYRTGMVGKWHLGQEPQFHPMARGFDEFFGMLQGGSTYTAGKAKRVLRGREKCEFKELPYLTDAFGDEAVQFIQKNKEIPFFLYLSFNAPHTPLQARPDYLEEERKKFKTEKRAINAAMTRSLDDNVGKVLATLRRLGLAENTLVIFTNDNGGAMPYNASSNAPYSGTKGTFLEGGVHVPMVAQWPATISPGTTYTHPVITLDFLPTMIAASGGNAANKKSLDGVDLLPFLSNERKSPPHESLMWRLAFHGAIRKDNWKLIWFRDRQPRLHDLSSDPAEQIDLSQAHPERTQELLSDFHAWEEGLAQPLWRTHPRWEKHSLKRYDQSFVETLVRE